MAYNCQFGQFFGQVTWPADALPGQRPASLTLTWPDGSTTELAAITFTVDPSSPRAETPRAAATKVSGVLMRYPDRLLDQIIAAYPGVPIAERGRGYVIFDVRPDAPGARSR